MFSLQYARNILEKIEQLCPEDSSVDVKIDGIFMFGKTWNYLQPTSVFWIKLPLFVKATERSRIKGCQFLLAAPKVYQVRLRKLGDYTVELVF